MLKHLLICALLLVPISLQAQGSSENQPENDLNWTVLTSWALPTQPLDFTQSLDNKLVFILGADQKVHIFAADGKKLGEMPVDPGTSAIDIAPRGEFLFLVNEKTNVYTAIDISFNKKIDISGAPILGNEDAPVTLIVFSDFECPHCSKVKPLLDQLLTTNEDKLRIAFKHLPLRMHSYAESAALSAIAAQNQGKFWQMHDALFAITNWTPTIIEETAKVIGLDMDKFRADRDSMETRMRLAKDVNDAQMADISATPSLFVNSRPVRDRSLPALQQMINEALDATGGTR
ncbi:thioredoxin domain-containing protein [Desulfobulbus alkaliphilus]|uniref:thioredoxin domain-containing protein n=1 Tax=Desulfobulbus alkaliphilus TaxID=869814 RepID=UPI001965AA03|nr:thioredoxin domain-containing protein [Desulfobulbus alkaliphilus]MBM9537755.1 thioredoxin domain-containing protein [Desulfobulbus alkaliphilus]